jgi:ribonuclease HII
MLSDRRSKADLLSDRRLGDFLKVRHTNDSLIEVGIDEAGRGPLWGPLYAAAVIWVPEEDMSDEQLRLAPLIQDSKKVSAKRRITLAEQIKNHALAWSVGSVTAEEIDEIGMTRANQMAFERALEGLAVEPERIIIDGCLSIYKAPWSMIPQVVEPEADGRYLPVAAASILAKVEHDEWITQFCELNSNIAERYDLLSSKGYGTARHRAGILEFGPHSLHRRLFLRKLLGN